MDGLERAEEDMARVRNPKTAGETVALFADTNAFYDYVPFGDIKWRDEVLKGADEVQIWIAPINLDELQDHKDSGRKPQLSERAASTMRWIDGFFSAAGTDGFYVIEPGVKFAVEHREPAITQGNPTSNDDKLIATILRYAEENPSHRVVLITADTGVKLKAKARRFGIGFVQLPDKYKSPPKLDFRDKRLAAVEKRLEALERRGPDLRVWFKDETQEIEVTLTEAPASLDFDQEMIRIRRKHQPVNLPKPPSLHADIRISHLFNQVLESSILAYNSELEAFYSSFRKYLTAVVEIEKTNHRTFRVDLVITNGGVVATDIDLWLSLPASCWVSENRKISMPDPPTPPTKPRTNAELMVGVPSWNDLGSRGMPSVAPARFINREIEGPSITRRDDSVRIHYKIQKLKHALGYNLDPFYVAAPADAERIEILYKAVAMETTRPAEGNLLVRFQRS